MKKITWSGYVVFTVLLILFISSSMPYQEQSIKPGLSRYIPLGFVDHLRFISFSYHGEVSVAALGRSGFIEFFIRKAAHVSSFLVLGIGLIDLTRRRLTPGLAGRFAYSLAITIAVFDEFHQILTGDRTGLVQDVLLDGTGALIGIGCYLLVRRKKVQRQAGSLSFWHEKKRHHF